MARRGANAAHIPIFRGRLCPLRFRFEFSCLVFGRFFSTPKLAFNM